MRSRLSPRCCEHKCGGSTQDTALCAGRRHGEAEGLCPAAALERRARQEGRDGRCGHRGEPSHGRHVERTLARASASWLSGGCSQRQITPQAAPSCGQPRPTSRLGRSGRPRRARFFRPRHGRVRPLGGRAAREGHAGHPKGTHATLTLALTLTLTLTFSSAAACRGAAALRLCSRWASPPSAASTSCRSVPPGAFYLLLLPSTFYLLPIYLLPSTSCLSTFYLLPLILPLRASRVGTNPNPNPNPNLLPLRASRVGTNPNPNPNPNLLPLRASRVGTKGLIGCGTKEQVPWRALASPYASALASALCLALAAAPRGQEPVCARHELTSADLA